MKFSQLRPILWTTDLDATIQFYRDVLGFTPASNFPNFVHLHRDDVALMFVRPTAEDPDCDPLPNPNLTGSLYFTVDDVDDMWERIHAKARVITPLCDREYGMRDFSVADNNGYEIVFGQDISKQ